MVNFPHNQYPSIPEVTPVEGQAIIDELITLPSARTHADMCGMEAVNEQGEVELINVHSVTSHDSNLQTVLGGVELASYLDDEYRNRTVTLYAKQVTGLHPSERSDALQSLFLVDTARSGDNYNTMSNTLAATPGLLYRNAFPDDERNDQSQLTTAVLQALGGGEGIKEFIGATKTGDTETLDRLQDNLRKALRRRGPEGVNTQGFDEQSWTDLGYDTPAAKAHWNAKNDRVRRKQDEEWAELPAVKKLAGWVISKLVNSEHTSGYETPQNAFFTWRRSRRQ